MRKLEREDLQESLNERKLVGCRKGWNIGKRMAESRQGVWLKAKRRPVGVGHRVRTRKGKEEERQKRRARVTRRERDMVEVEPMGTRSGRIARKGHLTKDYVWNN